MNTLASLQLADLSSDDTTSKNSTPKSVPGTSGVTVWIKLFEMCAKFFHLDSRVQESMGNSWKIAWLTTKPYRQKLSALTQKFPKQLNGN